MLYLIAQFKKKIPQGRPPTAARCGKYPLIKMKMGVEMEIKLVATLYTPVHMYVQQSLLLSVLN